MTWRSSLSDRNRSHRQAWGHVVRVRRKGLGLSQEGLGERAGWDRQSVGRFEAGQFSPTLDRLVSLAAALGYADIADMAIEARTVAAEWARKAEQAQ